MNTTFLGIIYFVAFSHAIMLTVALWTRSEKGKPARLLAMVLVVLAYKLFEGGATYSGLYQYVPHLLDLMPAMVMLLGPLFCGYVRHVTGQKPLSTKQWLMHFTPWIAFFIAFNFNFVFRSAELKIAMWQHIVAAKGSYGQLPTEIVIRLLAIKAHLTVYLWLSCSSLYSFSSSAKDLRSDNSAEVLNQLKFLALSFILLEVIWVSLFIGQNYFSLGTLSHVSQIWLLFIAVIVIAMGFSGLQRPNMIFTPEERLIVSSQVEENVEVNTESNTDKIKYIHSALPESTADEIAKLIEKTLLEKQLFLNEKLTLTELAKVLEIKSHTVSQVINQRMQTNFYKLINSYRIQQAVSLLEDDNVNWPIERIALESGFGNRVTFNKAFKEQMNCTASEYKKRQKVAS